MAVVIREKAHSTGSLASILHNPGEDVRQPIGWNRSFFNWTPMTGRLSQSQSGARVITGGSD